METSGNQRKAASAPGLIVTEHEADVAAYLEAMFRSFGPAPSY